MPLASNVALTTITGQFVDYEGNAIAGQIKFTMSKVLRNSIADQIVVPSTATATLDGSGGFTVTLPATDDPELSEIFTYAVEESFVGGRSYNISLPAVNSTIRTNLCTNPSAEANVGGTTPTNGTVGQNFSVFRTGIATSTGTSFAFTSTGGIGTLAWDRVATTVGSSYAWSAYVKDGTTNAQWVAQIKWYSVQTGGTVISTSTGTATAVNTSGWTRLSVIATAPAGATWGEAQIVSATSLTSTQYVFIDSCLFEQTTTVKSYFDGFSSDGLGGAPYWNGTPNFSTSTYPDFGGSIAYTSIAPIYSLNPTYVVYPNSNQWTTLDAQVQALDASVDQANGWFVLYNPNYANLTFKAYSLYASQNTYATLKLGPVIVANSDISPYVAITQGYQSAAESSNTAAQLSLTSIENIEGTYLHPFAVTGA
jgi:hypothetical protein